MEKCKQMHAGLMQTGVISLYLTIQTEDSQVCLISTYNEQMELVL